MVWVDGFMQLGVSDCLSSWYSDHHARAIAPESCDTPSFVEGNHYEGDNLCVTRIELQAVEKIYLRNPEPSFCFFIPEFGQFHGLVADRSICMTPQRLAFVMLPGESVKLVPSAEYVRLLQVSINVDLLLKEASLHGSPFVSLMTLNDSIPGHEQLILACALHLFKFSEAVDISPERVLQPLEASVISLLAALLGSGSDVPQSVDSDTTSHASYVQMALNYMEDNLSSEICLTDLCNVCCVSSRTLQVAFRSVMNRTPLQVLHELRLTQLRGLLLQGMEVGRACESVGLLHSGRISANYKRMFGELPRHTRSHRPKSVESLSPL